MDDSAGLRLDEQDAAIAVGEEVLAVSRELDQPVLSDTLARILDLVEQLASCDLPDVQVPRRDDEQLAVG